MKKINIIFDIDDTIATGFDYSDFSEYCLNNPWLKLFQKENLYFEAVLPHIIHPGVVEFIQILDKMPDVKLSFFSAGTHERNTILVEKLLKRSLGDFRYSEIKNDVTVCSREHLESSNNNEWIKEKLAWQWAVFGINFGNFKKTLHKILTPEDDIQWAILIEDDHTYTAPGQEKNLLTFYRATDYHFEGHFRPDLKEKDDDTFLRVNHVFGYAGVFFTALEKAQKNNTTLSDEIFNIHFKKNIDPREKSEFIIDYDVRDDQHYYDIGLKKFKEVNEDINFWTGA